MILTSLVFEHNNRYSLMTPQTKKYVGRLLITYGVPFLVMCGAIMYGNMDAKIPFAAAVWMFVAGMVTRGWK